MPSVVPGIHDLAEVLLLDVVQARRSARGILGLGQGREQHGRQDGDDRYDHQQLDQREPTVHVRVLFHFTQFHKGLSRFEH